MSNGNGKKKGKNGDGNVDKTRHHKKETLRWEKLFLEMLEQTANISKAAKLAGIHRSRAYQRRDESESFEHEWDEALEQGIASLEVELRRRALAGTQKPVFHQGEVCGHIQEYSDTLGMFLLKAHRPEVYRDRYEVSHKHSGEIEFRLGGMSPEQSIAKLDADLERLGLRR